MYKTLNENAGSMHMIGIDFSRRNDNFGFSDCYVATHRNQGIEIPCGLTKDEISLRVCFPRLYQGNVCEYGPLENIGSAVEFFRLFVPGNYRSDSRPCVEGGMPEPPVRMRSARVPWGANSISNSPAIYCRSASVFSPT
jgi:hypothetical protein